MSQPTSHRAMFLGPLLILAVFFALSVAAFCAEPAGGSSGSAASGSTEAGTRRAWPSHCFAPYVDVCLWPPPDFEKAAADTTVGVRHFVLAFVVAAGGKPCWGGQPTYPVGEGDFHKTIQAKIAAVRRAGGDVMISCGGASGVELAQAIHDVGQLQQAYQSIIDAYDLAAIDFDIEGAAVADGASIERRSRAIASLQQSAAKKRRPLKVWLTLPVLPSGLTPDGVHMLEAALNAGVRIDGVNIMCMDYGDDAAPNPRGQMGAYAIQAAQSVHGQLSRLAGRAKTDAELWGAIGICPMIGMNDTRSEVFTPADARDVLAFAKRQKLGLLAMWSFTRDQANPHGAIKYVEATSSSLKQERFEFCKTFRGFDESPAKSGNSAAPSGRR